MSELTFRMYSGQILSTLHCYVLAGSIDVWNSRYPTTRGARTFSAFMHGGALVLLFYVHPILTASIVTV